MYFHVTDVQINDEVIVFEGDTNVIFTCSSASGTRVEWLVNETLLEEPYPMGVTSAEIIIPNNVIIGGSLIFNNVSLDYNGTTVQCIATTNGNARQTNIGTLLVQGKDTLLI